MKRPPAELSLGHTSNLDALCAEHPKPKKCNPKQSPGRLLRKGAPWKVYVAAEGLGSFWPAQGSLQAPPSLAQVSAGLLCCDASCSAHTPLTGMVVCITASADPLLWCGCLTFPSHDPQ